MAKHFNEFHEILNLRLKRFPYLLNYAKLDFKQYQYDGVEWCLRSELRPEPLFGVRGGLIADEMGLGKTIMMIGTMFSNIVQRTLIVVPPILIQQWYNEIYRISGHKSFIYYGKNKKNLTKEKLSSYRIVLTTYNTISITKNKMALEVIHQLLWDRVIYDEAHHLRNKKTSRFLGCKNIRSRIRWFVTGTPIQNKKNDIFSLCNLLGFPSSFYTNENNINVIKTNYLLNRKKKEVGIDLLSINENMVTVDWNNIQEKRIAEEIHSIIRMSGVSHSKNGLLSNAIMPGGALISIMRAKQSCIMPSLMKKFVLKLINKDNLDPKYLLSLQNSSKINEVLRCLLERKSNGKGKIIFCHYRAEIDFIAKRLKEEGLTVNILDSRSHGKTRLVKIMEKVNVLILQIQTGCEGLNLQENYSEVYFVSPHWNPAIEDQAVARCHRIGQKNRVEVFRFIMNNFDAEKTDGVSPITLEKYIHEVQNIKRQISFQILG